MKLELPDEWFSDEELSNTPERWERFWEEWADSHDFDDADFTTFPNPGYDEMVIEKGIPVNSVCSHHLLPFYGEAHIGYIPSGNVCGLSKLARALNKFAHRPQLQERLTQQVADFLWDKLDPKGVMVVVEAEHMCMTIRGVKKPGTETVTSAVRGVFKDKDTVKHEFLELIG